MDVNDGTGFEIAVIGMAGRFPGAGNLDEFWKNLIDGKESISFLTDEEIKKYEINPGKLENNNYVKVIGGVLENKEFFDALFFGYTPKEAEIMDPQLRLSQECAWEVLENAGYDADEYNGLIGLYISASPNYYWKTAAVLSGKAGELGEFASRFLTESDFIGTKVAYKLNLRGPVSNISATCSSSLVSIHLACRSLLMGECDMALAGGVSTWEMSSTGYFYEEGMIHSPDGHCRSFDANARGTVNGEGVGIVLLKTLEEALEAGDYIHAVIKSSAVNNDGARKVGYTAPSIDGQAEVIRTALRIADIDPESITYIEAHGTGTELGDPMEVAALKLALNSDKKGFCAIGSVKTNIGHLDYAAGVAGFIKTVLALKHQIIPPSLHYQVPNPKIDFAHSPFYVNTRAAEWKRGCHPLRAGVHAFGIGGTNAHVILEEAPVVDQSSSVSGENKEERKYQLIVLSAKTPSALDKMTENLTEYFKKNLINHDHHENPANPAPTLADAAYTLQTGRKAFSQRKILVCSTTREAAQKLLSPDTGHIGTTRTNKPDLDVVFMFPDQGAQYVNMGLDLYKTEPVFREEMDRCFEILNPLMGYDVKEILYPGDSASEASEASEESSPGSNRVDRSNRSDKSPIPPIHQSEIAQPLLFSFEYALTRLLSKWGIEPQAMMGYSVGEYAAACKSGVFSLEDALKLVVLRGRSQQSSGMTAASLETFADQVRQIPLHPPSLTFISNVTGRPITAEEAVNPGYWSAHLKHPVRFPHGIKELTKSGLLVFLEVGPGNTLSTLVNRHQDDLTGPIAVNLVRPPEETTADDYYLLNKIGELWVYGKRIHWPGFYGEKKQRRISMPTYPFQGKKYWFADPMIKFPGEYGEYGESRRREPDMAEWFYAPSWERCLPPAAPSPLSPPGLDWLVFEDACGVARRVGNRLHRENNAHHIIYVKTGETFMNIPGQGYQINPARAEDYEALFAELWQANRVPHQVLHSWNVTDNTDREPGLEGYEKSQDLGIYSLLHIARALGRQHITGDIKILAVSNNMLEVLGEEELCPEKSTLLGAVKIIPLEYANIKCRSIDILLPTPASPVNPAGDRLAEQLLEELRRDTGEISTAIRGNHRWVPQYKPLRLEKPGIGNSPRQRLKQGGVYLITGGLGGIGFTLAQHLAKTFKARLILTGRSPFPPGNQWEHWLAVHENDNDVSLKIREVRDLETYGAEIMIAGADVAQYRAMQTVIHQAKERFGPIDGVIHAAGSIDDAGMIQQRTRAMTDESMAARVKGTLVLEDLLKDEPLDFFVLFSFIGNVLYKDYFGQVGFISANEFLESFALYKAGKNGPLVVTINWSDWLEKGMAMKALRNKHKDSPDSREKIEEDIKNLANVSLSPDEGVDIFNRILAHGYPRILVSPQHLEARLRHMKRREVKAAETPGTAAGPAGETFHERPGLSTPYTAPRNEIEKQMAAAWKNSLGFEPVGIEDDFFESGGDSLKALRVISTVNNRLRANLGIIDLYRDRTIEKLAAQVQRVKGVTAADELQEMYRQVETLKHRILADNRDLLNPGNIEDLYPMTEIQKGMVFDYMKFIDAAVYHDQFLVQFKYEDFQVQRFQKVVAGLVEKHQILRTGFNIDDFEESIQVVYKTVDYEVKYFDITGETNPGEFINHQLKEDLEQKFTLDRVPLWRMKLFLTGVDEIVLVLICHHAIMDGWSFASLMTELYQTDARIKLNPAYVPEPLNVTNKDAVVRELLEKKNSKSLEYWKNELYDYKTIDFFSREKKKDELMRFYNHYLDEAFYGALIKTAGKYKTTVKNLAFAAYVYVMTMISYENDVLVGLVSNTRPVCEDGDRLIGCFLNTVPVRIKIPAGLKWVDYLRLVEDKLLEVKKYERVPLFDILRTAVDNSRDRQSVFETLFNFVDFHVYNEVKELKSQRYMDIVSYMNTNTQFDFEISTTLGKFILTPKYNRSAISDEEVRRLCDYFKRILEKCFFDADSPMNRNEIIPGEEKQRILEEFNDTPYPYPGNQTLAAIFEQQVEKTPHRISLLGPGSTGPGEPGGPAPLPGHMSITYCQLNRKSNQLAGELRKKGVTPNCFVGIVLDRSIEMVTGVMGIIKASGAYVPLEPHLPEARMAKLLGSLNIRYIVTKTHWLPKIKSIVGQLPGIKCIFCLDEDEPLDLKGNDRQPLKETGVIGPAQLAKNPDSNPGPLAISRDMAYVIFTSGSTGIPKGVVETHQPVINVIEWVNRTFNIDPADKLLFVASLGFDLSVYDIFGLLACGASLRVTTGDDIREPGRLLDIMIREQVTFWDSAPAMMQQMVPFFPGKGEPGPGTGLRLVFLSGDWIPVSLPGILKETFTGVEVISLGGATEATIWSNYYPIGTVDPAWVSIPYGKPIQNAKYYILNPQLDICPIGVCGDLFIGGECLATGYINDVILTAGKFIRNPFVPGERMYKTGDVARWFEDGNMEFLGRKDNQVKIRGYRIELGEIETQLANYKDIEDVVVLVRGSGTAGGTETRGDRFLCAYFVPCTGVEIDTENLKDYLAGQLPVYMVPSYFIELTEMPVTPNGKVNRQALPGIEALRQAVYEAPRDQLEERVARIWSEVLKLEKNNIGIDDNFFQLGGHSLKAAVIISRIHKELEVKVPVAEVFASPTIRELSTWIREAEKHKYTSLQAVEKKEYYPLSSAQKRLYILQQMEINNTAYNQPQFFAVAGNLDRERLTGTFTGLVHRHESLRTSFEELNGESVQRIHPGGEFAIQYYPLASEAEAKAIVGNFMKPFDLAGTPLLRVGLIDTGPNSQVFMVDIHHIVTDGVSNALLIQDFMLLYPGKELPRLRLQYKDYSEWQQCQRKSKEMKRQEQYWVKQFQGDIPLLDLPVDYPRPHEIDFAGSIIDFDIDAQTANLLRKTAVENEVTLYMILLSLYIILLSKISAQEDIILGIVTAGRIHMDLDPLIGVFMNTMAFRSYPSKEMRFTDFLGEIKRKVLESLENQDYQFDDLVQKIGQREESHNPLFDVIFGFLNMENPAEKHSIAGLEFNAHDYQLHRSRFDMVFLGREAGDNLSFTLEYRTKLFKPATIEEFTGHFKYIVANVLEYPGKKIKEIEIMSPGEKEKIYQGIKKYNEDFQVEFNI